MGFDWLTLLLLLLLGWSLWRFNCAVSRLALIDWGTGWMNWVDGLNRLFCYRYHRLNLTRLRIPRSGPAIVVANHISGLDPLLLQASARRPLRFMIAREQYERFGLRWLFRASGCIPVDREKRPERALRAALRALQEGEVVAIFPQGGIQLPNRPPRKLKSGAVRLAQLAGATLYPARISGIAGEGHVLRGVLYRAHARIEPLQPIQPGDQSTDALNQQLIKLLR